jgi:hypothetical protein
MTVRFSKNSNSRSLEIIAEDLYMKHKNSLSLIITTGIQLKPNVLDWNVDIVYVFKL